jgi:hypothetical protein
MSQCCALGHGSGPGCVYPSTPHCSNRHTLSFTIAHRVAHARAYVTSHAYSDTETYRNVDGIATAQVVSFAVAIPQANRHGLHVKRPSMCRA